MSGARATGLSGACGPLAGPTPSRGSWRRPLTSWDRRRAHLGAISGSEYALDIVRSIGGLSTSARLARLPADLASRAASHARASTSAETPPAAESLLETQAPRSSPFSQATVHRSIGEGSEELGAGGSGGRGAAPSGGATGGQAAELTIESAEAALEEVRPYLMADGGDIRVLSVEDGVVKVLFRGACSGCASSPATLSMGVERSLRAAFGAAVRGVESVDEPKAGANLEAIDTHLNSVRGALRAYGGSVEVVGLQDGLATLWFTGPELLAKGVRASLLEAFDDVAKVRVVDPETGATLLEA